MSICPNINLQEWKDLEASVGKFNAYKYFLETGGRIGTPEEVKTHLEGTTLYQLVNPGDHDAAMGAERIKKFTERISQKFFESRYRFENLPDVNWKGKVVREDGQDVVVINTALATIDTPLHEFGHIFIAMIRKANAPLYAQLKKTVKAQYAPLIKEIKAYYGDIYNDEEIIEETMVELLGRNASAKVDQKTGEYLFIQEIWDAIVKQIKKFFGKNKDIIDVSNIKASTKIGMLADLLANDSKISIGSYIKEEGSSQAIRNIYSEMNSIDTFIKDELTTTSYTPLVLQGGNKAMLVKTQVVNSLLAFLGGKENTGQLEGRMKPLMDYIKSDQITTDFHDMVNYVHNLKIEATNNNKNLRAKDIRIDLEQRYPKLFVATLLNPFEYISSDTKNYVLLEALYRIFETSENVSVIEAFNYFETKIAEIDVLVTNLKDQYTKNKGSFISDALENNYNWQSILSYEGNQNRKPFIKRELWYGEKPKVSYDRDTDSTKNAYDLLTAEKVRKMELIKTLRNNPLEVSGEIDLARYVPHLNKKVYVEAWDPVSQNVIKERIDISAPVVNFKDHITGMQVTEIGQVAFSSSIFGYGDAFELTPLSKDKYDKDKLYWSYPTLAVKDAVDIDNNMSHAKEALFKFYNETDDYIEIELGVDKGQPLPLQRKILTKHLGVTEFNTQPVTYLDSNDIEQTKYILIAKIPKAYRNKLSIVTSTGARVNKIMNEVISSIWELNYATDDVRKITFSPVRSSITDPKGVIKRAMIYTLTNRRMYGDDFMIEVKNPLDWNGKRIIPYSELEKAFKNLTEADKARRLKELNNKRRFSRTETIRIEKFDLSSFVYMEAVTDQILIPESYKSSFMSASESRPLYQIIRNTEKGALSSNPSFAELAEYTQGRSSDQVVTTDQLKNTKAVELANKLSATLGIDYEMISEKTATELTKNMKNPWSGESAFFYNNKVYFVGEGMSTDNVLHEFSHPLVRHIANVNNKAFQKLYNELLSTEEGQAIIATLTDTYPDLELESDRFKEEAIVRALTTDGLNKINGFKTKGGFKEAIKNILFAIKQALRKVFGKAIPISKIDSVTTLNELSDILVKGGKIEINTEILTDDDLIAYNREAYADVTGDLQNIKHKDIQSTINTFYDMIQNQLNMLIKNQNYEELAEILTDEFQRGDLQAMRSNLSQWQTAVANIAAEFDEDVRESRNRVEALANTLFRLETVMEKVFAHIQDISKYPDTQDNMHKAYYYDKIITYWTEFMEDFEAIVDDPSNSVPDRSPLVNLKEDILRNLRRSKNIINEMYAEGARDAVYEQMEPINRTLRNRYEKIISDMREREAPQERIDAIYREYHGMPEAEYRQMNELLKRSKASGISVSEQKVLDRLLNKSQNGLSISKDKIEAILKGNMGDANWYNSYLEGYLYNTDPVVGGMALYTKNAMSEMIVNGQKKANTFFETMRPLLVAAGYNPQKIAELGEKIGFKDKVAKWNRDTGEFEEREVWTFLNKFKDYRYEQDKLMYQVDQAQKDHAQSNTPETKKALLDAIANHKTFERNYMHQEFTKEFYERYELLEKDDIGKEASHRREKFFEELRQLTEPAKTQSDNLFIADEVDDLWRDYRQMHSRYDLNGKLKTGTEAEIAKRLRAFKNQSRDFYEWKMRKGVFENAYLDFLEELRYDGVEESEDPNSMWKMRINEWKVRNSRRVIKDEWYQRRNEILDSIKTILDKLPQNERAKVDQAAIWEEIIELSSGFRDENNQIIGSDLSQGSLSRIKELQEQLERMKEEEIRSNGLTQIENDRMFELINQRKANGRLDRMEFDELQALFNKKDTFGLSKADAADLTSYYEELSEMTEREATPYYVDILNNWLSKLNTDVLDKQFKTRTVTETSAHIILDEKVLESLLGQDAGFDSWFKSTHYKKGRNQNWSRIYAWNIIKPSNPNMMESYEIKDSTGKVLDVVEGLPALNYYARVAKEKYKTRKIIGETVDNKGRFLPKTIEDGAVDGRYINEDYQKMRTEDPALFAVLEKMKEFHLKHQEGLSYKSRLYLDYPRFIKQGLEVWQSTSVNEYGQKKWNALSQFIQRIKDWLYGDKARAEDGFNYEDDFNLVRADMFDNEITDIPIAGLYNVDADDVSLDIGQNMLRYMLSAERQKQLVRISPVVRAIQNTLKSNTVYDLDRVNEAEFKNRGILRYLPKKDNVRLSAVNNFIEREFEGQRQASEVANTPWLNNFSNFMFKRASFSFFALNIPSALKNSLGMKFQQMIEASGGQFVDHVSLQKGNGWAYKTMGEMSFNGQLYKVGAKSHNLQLVEIFDAIQDRFAERIGENMSRTMLKDTAELSWLYSPRKWVENQATLQLFAGMLYKKKVKIMTDDGEKEIPYIEAFETIDGQTRLKDGIDVRYAAKSTVHFVEEGDTIESLAKKYNIPEEEVEEVFSNANIKEKLENLKQIEEDREDALSDIPDLDTIDDDYERLRIQDKIDAINKKYDNRIEKKATVTISNSEFNYMKNQIQQVTNNMGGAYAKFDQPEAQRYLFFRFISYLRRYFTTMFINRWGFSGPYNDPKPRLNPGLGDVQMGFYIQFGKTLIQTIKQAGSNLQYLTDAEKTAVLKMFTEIVMLLGTTALMSLLFGWDPDDDERYSKLREKSGALPFPLTGEDPDRDFDLFGYMEVHALHMLMQVRGENEQFNLLTGALKHYNSLLDIKSVAFGPTTDSYVQLWEDTKAMASGDDSAYYSRKVGPYNWQQQGGSKFLTHLVKTFGLTGSSLDPAMAIQNFQTYQAKVRR
jgi:hypothetical protein